MENSKLYDAGDLICFNERPHLIIKIFTNNAGVKYDALIIPISSKNKVGSENIVEITHKKLKCVPSYLKVINLKTVKINDLKKAYKISSIDKEHLAEIVEKIKNIL